MVELIDRFNELLKEKTSFYDEVHNFRSTYRHTRKTELQCPSKVIMRLHKLNHKFTQEQLNLIVKCIVYRKGSSYLVMDHGTRAKKAIFSQFNPNAQQEIQMASCYTGDNRDFTWVDALVAQHHNFQPTSIDLLKKAGYNKRLECDISTIVKQLEQLCTNVKQTTYNKINSLLTGESIQVSPQAMLNVINSDWGWYSPTMPHSIVEFMDLLLQYGTPTREVVEQYFRRNRNYNLFVRLVQKAKLSQNDLMDILRMCCWTGSSDHVAFLVKHMDHPPSTECLNIAFQKGLDLDYKVLESLGYDREFIENIISRNLHIETFNFFIESGTEPNEETLELACRDKLYNVFSCIVNMFGIEPNSKCLQISFNCRKLDTAHNILEYKIVPTIEDFKALYTDNVKVEKRVEFFELLVRYGLSVTIDMIGMAIKHRDHITKLNRFGIEYDNKIYGLCHRYNFWPEEYVREFNDKMDSRILNMHAMCKKRTTTLTCFFKYLKKHQIKPDRYCLELCCQYNKRIAESLIEEFDCEPTLGCLIRAYGGGPKQRYRYTGWTECEENFFLENIGRQLLDQYVIDPEIMIQPYDIDFKDISNRIKCETTFDGISGLELM